MFGAYGRGILEANRGDALNAAGTATRQHAQGALTVALLGVTGDAVNDGVTVGSLAKDVGLAFVPGSNTISALGNVRDACNPG